MSNPLWATPSGSAIPASILATKEPAWLTESPDSIRLLGPIWTASGLTIQGPCRLFVGDHWRTGRITATGSTFAIVATSTGSIRCEDRRNLQNSEEATDFKRQRSRFLRLLQKRQEGGQNNG